MAELNGDAVVAGEWVEHDGKGTPDLPADTKVQTRRDFGETEDSLSSPWPWEWWHHAYPEESNWIWPNGVPEEWSIIAYRVVTQ